VSVAMPCAVTETAGPYNRSGNPADVDTTIRAEAPAESSAMARHPVDVTSPVSQDSKAISVQQLDDHDAGSTIAASLRGLT